MILTDFHRNVMIFVLFSFLFKSNVNISFVCLQYPTIFRHLTESICGILDYAQSPNNGCRKKRANKRRPVE